MKVKKMTILMLLVLVCLAAANPARAVEPGENPPPAPNTETEESVTPEEDPVGEEAETAAVQNTVADLKLSLGQSAFLRYSVLQAGPLSWELCVDEMDPRLLLQFSIINGVSEDGLPSQLHGEVIAQSGGSTGKLLEVAAGDVLLFLTPGMAQADLPTEPLVEAPSLTLQVTVSGNLEPNAEAPAAISVVSPVSGSEYYGQEPYLTMEVHTEPFFPVYFGTSEEAVAADQDGKVSQSMRLSDGLVNSLQAFTISPSGHISLASVVVINHWVTQDPAQTVRLGRQPTIELAVPDASLVDLERSSLAIDGQPLPLQCDLAKNLVFAQPTEPLTLGAHRIEVVLIGQGGEQQPPPLLDSLSWQFVIPEFRLAEFWLYRTTYLANQQQLAMDVAPYLESGTTMLPLSVLADLMDAHVQWLAAERGVIFQRGDKRVQVFIDRTTAFVDGQAVELTLAPTLVNDRTMVPLRFVTENLGAQVTWNAQERKITVQVLLD